MESPTAKRVSKACDACKLRKVKCNGQERCAQCSHLGLKCIYTASSSRRSQGKRGRVIIEYKNKTAHPSAISPPILPASPSQPDFQSPYAMLSPTSEQSGGHAGMSAQPQYSHDFFLDLIPDYMEAVYPVQPVITESELRNYIQVMASDQDVLSFVHAFGACTLNLTRYGDKRTEEVNQTIENLVNFSIKTLRPPLAGFRASVMRAMQSMFIHNCLMTMQASDAAFYYMRDAISDIQLLRIDAADSMAALPPPERARRQRLYWQAFIHERFVAILDYRPTVLSPLDNLPEHDPTIPIAVHEGFAQIIKLFSLLDSEFLQNWLGSHGNVTCAWVEAKSRELEGDDEDDAQGLSLLSMMQKADLAITREWLRTLVWRLAMSQTLLSSRTSKECLSLLFPVRLSQSLRQQVTSMSREDIGVHGSSIVQKLFEISDTIADVLIHVPAATLEETALRIDDFLFILDFVLLFPTLDQTRRGILLEKLERLQSMFPEVCSSTSSPNMPGVADVQSPINDPWYHVTQSKIGPDATSDPAALDFTAPFATGLEGLRPDQEVTQKAAWNHISRRLSMATFSND